MCAYIFNINYKYFHKIKNYGLTFVINRTALHTICEKTIKHLPVLKLCF